MCSLHIQCKRKEQCHLYPPNACNFTFNSPIACNFTFDCHFLYFADRLAFNKADEDAKICLPEELKKAGSYILQKARLKQEIVDLLCPVDYKRLMVSVHVKDFILHLTEEQHDACTQFEPKVEKKPTRNEMHTHERVARRSMVRFFFKLLTIICIFIFIFFIWKACYGVFYHFQRQRVFGRIKEAVLELRPTDSTPSALTDIDIKRAMHLDDKTSEEAFQCFRKFLTHIEGTVIQV